jgi:DNA-directed RNA polymerase subunit RPC12/RpoP
MGEDSKLVSYMCKTCKTLFFSTSEVTYHKAMTGHGVYEERERKREQLDRPMINMVYWCKKCHAAFIFRIDATNHAQETGHADLALTSLNELAQ